MIPARVLFNLVETWVVDQEGRATVDAWLRPEPVDEVASRRNTVLAMGGEVG